MMVLSDPSHRSLPIPELFPSGSAWCPWSCGWIRHRQPPPRVRSSPATDLRKTRPPSPDEATITAPQLHHRRPGHANASLFEATFPPTQGQSSKSTPGSAASTSASTTFRCGTASIRASRSNTARSSAVAPKTRSRPHHSNTYAFSIGPKCQFPCWGKPRSTPR